MVCGDQYDANTNGGLCPSTGAVYIMTPPTAGQYTVVLVAYHPPNEFGQDGYRCLFDVLVVCFECNAFEFFYNLSSLVLVCPI